MDDPTTPIPDALATNRAVWDEHTRIHVRGTGGYDVEGFKAGRCGVRPNIPDDLGDVRGLRLLHLQCHFGLDTLMWARQGAEVTGVDFSPEAIAAATTLRDEVGLNAEFVEANVLELPEQLFDRFDLVVTYYGVLPWLPDLTAWAGGIARCLVPSGRLYVADTHPVAAVYEVAPGDDQPTPQIDYFRDGRTSRYVSEQGTYADPSAPREHTVTYEWEHSLADILGAVIGVGLRLEYLHEFPYTFYNLHYYAGGEPLMEQDAEGWWWMRRDRLRLPLMYSLLARA